MDKTQLVQGCDIISPFQEPPQVLLFIFGQIRAPLAFNEYPAYGLIVAHFPIDLAIRKIQRIQILLAQGGSRVGT